MRHCQINTTCTDNILLCLFQDIPASYDKFQIIADDSKKVISWIYNTSGRLTAQCKDDEGGEFVIIMKK